MIGKLRIRFVFVAMLSMTIVLVAIVGGMNLWNYRELKADADRTNQMIVNNDGVFPSDNTGGGPGEPGQENSGQEPMPLPSGENKAPEEEKINPKATAAGNEGNAKESQKTDATGNAGKIAENPKATAAENAGVTEEKPEPPEAGNAGKNPGQQPEAGGINSQNQTNGESGEERKEPPEAENKDVQQAGQQKTNLFGQSTGISPEAPFETRYFSVHLDESGTVVSSHLDNIAAVSETQAKEMAQQVMQRSSDRGFLGVYRYYRAAATATGGTIIAYTDCNRALDTFSQSVKTSALASLAGIAAVFALVVFFSKIIFRPVAESYEKQKQFITDASHEIKTPLTIIDANVEVMEMMSGENKWTKSTKNQVKRLAALAGQLITLSRMDEEKNMENRMRFSLTDAVLDTASTFEDVAHSRSLSIVCYVEESIFFTGEEKRIRQMLGIFLDNSVKYALEESEIRISLKRKGRKILFEIYNETDQLEKGTQNILFERFYRSDASRNSETGGSGIGLSVAKAVADAHKGKLTAESVDGKSLTITLVLPADKN